MKLYSVATRGRSSIGRTGATLAMALVVGLALTPSAFSQEFTNVISGPASDSPPPDLTFDMPANSPATPSPLATPLAPPPDSPVDSSFVNPVPGAPPATSPVGPPTVPIPVALNSTTSDAPVCNARQLSWPNSSDAVNCSWAQPVTLPTPQAAVRLNQVTLSCDMGVQYILNGDYLASTLACLPDGAVNETQLVEELQTPGTHCTLSPIGSKLACAPPDTAISLSISLIHPPGNTGPPTTSTMTNTMDSMAGGTSNPNPNRSSSGSGSSKNNSVAIGVGVTLGVTTAVCIAVFAYMLHRKRKYSPAYSRQLSDSGPHHNMLGGQHLDSASADVEAAVHVVGRGGMQQGGASLGPLAAGAKRSNFKSARFMMFNASALDALDPVKEEDESQSSRNVTSPQGVAGSKAAGPALPASNMQSAGYIRAPPNAVKVKISTEDLQRRLGRYYKDPMLRKLATKYSWCAADTPGLHPLEADDMTSSMAARQASDASDAAILAGGEQSGAAVQLTSQQVVQELRLVEGGMIDQGSAGVLFKCTWPSRFGDNALLAIKIMRATSSFDHEYLMKSYTYEAKVLSRCRHRNVVRLFGWCLEPPNVCLIMELLPWSLWDRMYVPARKGGAAAKSLKPLGLHDAIVFSEGIAAGLAHLHARPSPAAGTAAEDGDANSGQAMEGALRVVHRDLKPGNVLLSSKGVPKISDFGLARAHENSASSIHTQYGNAGTLHYLAPELIGGTSANITTKVDIYSLGVVMWELLVKQPPWPQADTQVLLQVGVGQRPPLPPPPPSRAPSHTPPAPSHTPSASGHTLVQQSATSGKMDVPTGDDDQSAHNDGEDQQQQQQQVQQQQVQAGAADDHSAGGSTLDVMSVLCEAKLHKRYCDVLTCCWHQLPGQRPTAAEVQRDLHELLQHSLKLQQDACTP